MRARLKPGWSKAYPELTLGNVYRVLGIENDHLRIVSDAGEPILFHPRAFELVDPTQPPDWISEQLDGALYAYPPALRDPRGFFEQFFDYDMRVRTRFHGYVHQLAHAEGERIADPPNTYVRIDRDPPSAQEPTAVFLELDSEGWEVRRVEVFVDGRIGYASARGTFGPTVLGPRPRPPGAGVAITRDELESMWDRALRAEERFDRRGEEP